MSRNKPCEHSVQQTAEPWLCMTGSVSGSIRRPGAGQVALTSGPLALNHCNDSPRHWEPVEIISSGPVSAEGRLAHCLLRTARHSSTLNLTCQLWGHVQSWMELTCKHTSTLNWRITLKVIEYGFGANECRDSQPEFYIIRTAKFIYQEK